VTEEHDEMANHFATPTEQHLTCGSLASITRMGVEDPPQLTLVMDVTHNETGLDWRQEINFNGMKMLELTQLMIHTCEQVGLDWTVEAFDPLIERGEEHD